MPDDKKPVPIVITLNVRIQAIAVPEEAGGYSIAVPALEGCFSEADTMDEAILNAKEAAEGWLASLHGQRAGESYRAMVDPLPSEMVEP